MLKYLFTAVYKDGRVYQQNVEDKSIKEPEKRSCFFDIAQDIDKLVSFALKGEGHEYLVDLENGHFEIDGLPFVMHEGHIRKIPGDDGEIKSYYVPLTEFKLIFFRQHTHDIRVGQNINEEIRHEIVYRMGWQCTVDGKNYQEIMQFI